MTHWDMLNKENSNWWLSLTCSSASFALQYGDFVPRDYSAAKGPLLLSGPKVSISQRRQRCLSIFTTLTCKPDP